MTGTRHRDHRECGDTDDRPADVDRAIERIDERAAAARDRQVERALSELDARGEHDGAARAAVRAVADRLTARLVATPKRALRAAATDSDAAGDSPSDRRPDGDDAVRVALELFGD